MLHLHFLLYYVINILTGIDSCAAQNYADQRDLMDLLFDLKRYRKEIRPVKNLSETLQVNFSHEIRMVESLDVPAAEVCVLSYITLSWFDQSLYWNSSDFHGLEIIDLPVELVWIPHVDRSSSITCGPYNKQQELVKAKLTSDGRMQLNIIQFTSSFCVINMFLYPFDEHECFLIFYDSRYSDKELQLNLMYQEVVIKHKFIANQEWNFKRSFSSSYNLPVYEDSVSISIISNNLQMSRRPGFVIVNLFVPAWLLSFMNLCVPLIPPDCGERLSFAVTLCLAMIFVNMTLVADMPRNSLKIGVLSWLLTITDVMHTLGIIWTIFIIRISKLSNDSTKIPSVFLRLLRRQMKSKNNESDAYFNAIDKQAGTDDSKSVTQNTKSVEDKDKMAVSLIRSRQMNSLDWYDISRFLDKIYFLVTILMIIVMVAVNLFIFREKLLELF